MKLPDWVIESVKEFFRVVVLAIIPVAIISLQDGVFQLRAILITGAIAGLKFIDSALHEFNKEQPKKDQNTGLLGEKGITGF